jgi:hypothetical protein
MATKYVIQWRDDPSFCIGVSQVSSGSPVVLTLLQGAGSPTTQWYMDANTGFITSVADPSLCLDINGVNPGNHTPLIVANIVLGRPYQSWNWVGSPGRIMNNGALNFYVDNKDCKRSAGNPIILYDVGGQCQWWRILAVPTLEMAAAAEREEVVVAD